MKNRKQHLLINEKQSCLGMYLFGLSTLGELSNSFTKQSNFAEDIVGVQGEIIQSDMNDIQNKTEVKCNMCKSDTDDIKKRKALKCNKCQSDKCRCLISKNTVFYNL